MQKNVPTFFWLLFFQFLHGSKGEFLNYILKCNRLKSTNVQPEKKKWHTEQGMKNFVYKWLQKTFGSSRLAKLSAQECNLGTPGEAWQPALTRHGDCWTGGQRLPVCCTLCLHNRNFQEPGLPIRNHAKAKPQESLQSNIWQILWTTGRTVNYHVYYWQWHWLRPNSESTFV